MDLLDDKGLIQVCSERELKETKERMNNKYLFGIIPFCLLLGFIIGYFFGMVGMVYSLAEITDGMANNIVFEINETKMAEASFDYLIEKGEINISELKETKET